MRGSLLSQAIPSRKGPSVSLSVQGGRRLMFQNSIRHFKQGGIRERHSGTLLVRHWCEGGFCLRRVLGRQRSTGGERASVKRNVSPSRWTRQSFAAIAVLAANEGELRYTCSGAP